MDSAIDVRRIAGSETIDLRHRVMWPDAPRKHVILEGDEEALHYGAFFEGGLVGVGSFFVDDKRVRLRKMAVDVQCQGRGIASRLLSVAMDDLRASGFHEIWCDARTSALNFYRKNGFSIDTKTFQKHGLDYVIATRVF